MRLCYIHRSTMQPRRMNSGRGDAISPKERAMRTNRTLVVTLAFLLVGTLSFVNGCKKKPPQTTEEAKPETPTTPPPTEVAPPPRPAPPPVETSPLSASLEELNQKGYLKDAFFEFDKADLRD